MVDPDNKEIQDTVDGLVSRNKALVEQLSQLNVDLKKEESDAAAPAFVEKMVHLCAHNHCKYYGWGTQLTELDGI